MLIYFAFVLGIGVYLKRFTRSEEDFFLAGRNNSSWVAGNLVEADALEEFQNKVGREYRARTGRETLFYFSRLSSGTAVLDV